MSYNPQNPNGQATSANSAPVVVASDQSALPVKVQDGSGNAITSTGNALDINIKSGNPTTITATQATGSNLHTVIDSGTVTTVSTVTNLSQLGGTAIAMNTGTRSAGTQRVTIATDDVVPASQSGTWTVQPGNTANTTPWLVSATPATSGGMSTYHLVSAASTNATVVKASAGQLYGWMISNTTAAYSYVAFHNTTSTPTAGASIFFKIGIPPNGGANVEYTNGIAFSSGIAITTVTGTADSNNTAVAANDLVINLFYK